MLVDELYLTLKAGKGGKGCVSFFPGKTSGPDGGDGGNGGNIYVVGVTNFTGLNRYARMNRIEAEKGQDGLSFKRIGAYGPDTILPMPVGTSLKDLDTGRVWEIEHEGQRFLVCRGGVGGRGNEHFKSATYRAPRKAEPGEPGEEKRFKVVLKLIADYGLIGLPNAGKSSLLNELTAAAVKTANYPFTTLEPNLGVIENGKVLADIPGLIEGASTGKGLGTRFLKHIEKVSLLLHCVSAENEDVVQVYETVRKELENHNPELIEKDEIILLTKLDLVSNEELLSKKKALEKKNNNILTMSIHDFDSLQELKKKL